MRPEQLALLVRKRIQDKQYIENRNLRIKEVQEELNIEPEMQMREEQNNLIIQTTEDYENEKEDYEPSKKKLIKELILLTDDNSMASVIYSKIINNFSENDIQLLTDNFGGFLKQVKQLKGSSKLTPDTFLKFVENYLANYLSIEYNKSQPQILKLTNEGEMIELLPNTNMTKQELEYRDKFAIAMGKAQEFMNKKEAEVEELNNRPVKKQTNAHFNKLAVQNSLIITMRVIYDKLYEDFKKLDFNNKQDKQNFFNKNYKYVSDDYAVDYKKHLDKILDTYTKDLDETRNEIKNRIHKLGDKKNTRHKLILNSMNNRNVSQRTIENAIMYDRSSGLKPLLQDIVIPTPDLSVIGGKGLHNKSKYKKKLIFGKGITTKKNLIQINKFFINVDELNNGILKLKYVKNRNIVPGCPIQRGLSKELCNLIFDLANEKFEREKFDKLSKKEQEQFINFCNAAHYDIGEITLDKEDEDEKQLNILLGEYNAGNKTEIIKKQIQKILHKAMLLNKISTRTALIIMDDIY